MHPRPYQLTATADVKQAFAQGHRSVLMVMPTGGGKTFCFAMIAQQVVKKGGKVLLLTDREELQKQSAKAFQFTGLQPYFIGAGVKYVNTHADVFVAMSQTLRNRFKDPKWVQWVRNNITLVVVDECHCQEFNHFFIKQIAQDIYVLGVTATPKRSGKQRQLAIDYRYMVETVTVKKLIEQGFLVNCDTYTPFTVDTKGVAFNPMNGDFKENPMFAKFNQTVLYKGVVDNWLKLCKDSRTLVFCVNQEHAIKTCQEFVQNGIDAHFIVSGCSMPKSLSANPTQANIERYNDGLRRYNLYHENYSRYSGERSAIFAGFERGDFPVLINVDITTKGYDCPPIETVILNRATLSQSLFLQMIGRGARISPTTGKTHFNLLDFGGNISRHGEYTDERVWDLWHEESKGGGIPPMKNCGIDSGGGYLKGSGDMEKGCGLPILASMMLCPFCGFKYPTKREMEAIELTLALGKAEKIKAKVGNVADMTPEQLMDYAKSKGHPQAWIWRQIFNKEGLDGIEKWGKAWQWKPATIWHAKKFCEGL